VLRQAGKFEVRRSGKKIMGPKRRQVLSSPPPKGGGEVSRRSRDGEGDNGAGYGSEGEAARVLSATRTWTLYSAPVLFPHHCPPLRHGFAATPLPQHSLGARTEPHSPPKSRITLSGPKPRYSSGCPLRFTQTVWNPNIAAPAMSQRLDDWNEISLALQPK
jgi:hypothetical protein